MVSSLPSAVTLGGACDGGGAAHSLCDLLQWAVGLQQQRRHRLSVRKRVITAYCGQLAGAGPGYVYVCLNRKLSKCWSVEGESVIPLQARSNRIRVVVN